MSFNCARNKSLFNGHTFFLVCCPLIARENYDIILEGHYPQSAESDMSWRDSHHQSDLGKDTIFSLSHSQSDTWQEKLYSLFSLTKIQTKVFL